MGDRYWLTGVQLGLLQVLPKDRKLVLLQKIEADQFLCNKKEFKKIKQFLKAID